MRRHLPFLTRTDRALVILLVCVVLVAEAPTVLARSGGFVSACGNNLKNLAIALELYGADHGGAYPSSLTLLTPTYIRTIPVCPFTEFPYLYERQSNPERFRLVCTGWAHRTHMRQPDRNLVYTSTQGLIETADPAPSPQLDQQVRRRIRQQEWDDFWRNMSAQPLFWLGVVVVIPLFALTIWRWVSGEGTSSPRQ